MIKIRKRISKPWNRFRNLVMGYSQPRGKSEVTRPNSDFKTLQDVVDSLSNRNESIAISWKEGREIKRISYIELYDQIINYSKGFLELGLEQGDRVAIFSKNVPEWLGLTLGIDNAGLIDVPRGENTNVDEIAYILGHSEPKIVIVEDEELLDKVEKAKNKNPNLNLELIVSINRIKGVTHISEIEKRGIDSNKKIPRLDKDFTSSIIYTSGTTADPNGVELTHGNFASNITALRDRVPVTQNDLLFSILPPWHIFDRMQKYGALASGAETFHGTPELLQKYLALLKPTIMGSVPLIWERIYKGIIKEVNKKGYLQRKIFNAAINSMCDYSQKNSPSTFRELAAHYLLEKKVFPKLRSTLGEKFVFAISGGGALPPHIDNLFYAAGIEILDGYGMTECLVVSTRIIGRRALGTIGKPLEGIEVEIRDSETYKNLPTGEEGSIYVRGPNVMKGYYRDNEKTKEILSEEGWLKTGDRGYFDEQGNIVFTTREKEIIVLSTGVNVPPVPLETALKTSEYISEAVVVGQDWKSLGALIIPDFESLERYKEQNSVTLNPSQIKEFYRNEIDKLINTELGFQNYQLIRDFELLDEEFKIGKELTPTHKVKRRVLDDIYSKKMTQMYKNIHPK